MTVRITLLFLLSGLFEGHCLLPRQFFYAPEIMTWTVAQTYCRQKYTDLAFVLSQDDINQMKAALPTIVAYNNAWIGGFNLSSETDNTTTFSSSCVGIDTNTWKQINKDCMMTFPVYCSQDVGKRVVLRMKLTPDGQVDLSDPVIKAKILVKINENFNKIGFGDVIKIRWLTRQNRQPKIVENSTCEGK